MILSNQNHLYLVKYIEIAFFHEHFSKKKSLLQLIHDLFVQFVCFQWYLHLVLRSTSFCIIFFTANIISSVNIFFSNMPINIINLVTNRFQYNIICILSCEHGFLQCFPEDLTFLCVFKICDHCLLILT